MNLHQFSFDRYLALAKKCLVDSEFEKKPRADEARIWLRVTLGDYGVQFNCMGVRRSAYSDHSNSRGICMSQI